VETKNACESVVPASSSPIDLIQASVDRIKVEYDNVQLTAMMLVEENDKLRAMEREGALHKDEIDGLRKSQQEARAKIDSLAKANQALVEENNNLKAKYEALKSKIEGLLRT
jgi:predicted nuclease with TOPRIM domain